jgi:hypothetical protein
MVEDRIIQHKSDSPISDRCLAKKSDRAIHLGACSGAIQKRKNLLRLPYLFDSSGKLKTREKIDLLKI